MTRFLATFAVSASLLLAAGVVHAQTPEPATPAPAAATPVAPPAPDCAAQATDKKLAGAALTSFMKKCERDAVAKGCEVQAADKKLKGAAKASFTKKCVKDAAVAPAGQ
ncbi:MAG: hypothetical protein CTY15_01335 [Methylocystis sp.]|nr:MAG: hypothetical protein CTY15_01335 [Methylocystis sp.]